MSGVTMCYSDNCPIKKNCYRASIRPGDASSWTNFEYTCNEFSGFDSFIKYKRGDDSNEGNKERRNIN